MPPEEYCYYQNRVMPLWEARVSPDDLGMLRGFSVYEGMTAFGSYPFHFKDHWAHFSASAKAIGLKVPLTEDEAFDAASALIKKNIAPGTRSSLRMILSGGPAINGLEYDDTRSNFYILCQPATPVPHALYEKGASLISYEHQRSLPDLKTTNYLTTVTLQPKRKSSGALEILYYSHGNALECSTSNIFIVEDGHVVTPKDGVLKGVTRNLVLKLAAQGYTPEEREITMDELFLSSEVFITSSFKDIVPIVSVDGKQIGDGKPGPVTRALMEKFQAYVKEGGH